MIVPLPGGAHLSLHAMPVVGAMGRYLPATPLVLLTAATHSGKASVSADVNADSCPTTHDVRRAPCARS